MPEPIRRSSFTPSRGRELRRVAEALEMTPNRIYVAKSRCLKMLRQILLELNESDPELELLRDEV